LSAPGVNPADEKLLYGRRGLVRAAREFLCYFHRRT
jgi:hypothetical protein